MSVVATYHIFVCALFLVQGGVWTLETRNYTCSLMMICNVLSKHVGAVKVF